MSTSDKKPGLLRDPWRNTAPEPAAATLKTPTRTTSTDDEGVDKDLQPNKIATIDVRGYGAISVEGVSEPVEAAVALLAFCVENRKQIENIFTDHGIVIAQMPAQKIKNIKFYVQRGDGWMFAIPGVLTRDAGCIQLIQALIQLNTVPELKKKLEQAKISVYKF